TAPTVGPGWSTQATLPMSGQMVSILWDGPPQARIALRSHRPGQGWSPWVEVHAHEGEGPDADSPEASAARPSAGPVWVGDGTDRVELRLDEGRLTGLELEVMRSTDPSPGLFSLDAAAASPTFPGV